jgi:Fe-S cluster assembly iron-binding protein IscA
MKITEQAKVELKNALASFDKPGAGIRIYSTQGCCGPSIQMDLSTQVEQNETQISMEDLDFYIANDLLPTLEGVTIDYGYNGFRISGLEKNGGGCCG